jgi:glucosamine--fructose-6-phosphate aminotransferase (isomerizing)
MCGIVTAISTSNVVPILLEGLRKLEYRGYDSAGLAVLNEGLHRLRAAGRVAELAALADASELKANIGIAHTRWATHGVPSERNAHPHISAGLAVVHNGIIENFEAIKESLQARGYVFTSETDTEAIAHLIHHKLASSARPIPFASSSRATARRCCSGSARTACTPARTPRRCCRSRAR